MAEKLTPQQARAVCDRGGKLLVSAAAGSGKTKVLVDRLLSYLLDENDPANIDDFLIITYTKAAAAELRGKIAAKLTDRIAQTPENRHLQRQLQRLYLAKISTVHAFCSDTLRQYAYRLDLSADFRVAEENECQQLRQAAMEQVLENAYSCLDSNSDFRAFLDTQGLGRDDRLVPQILMTVYDSARCHLSPEEWLEDCIRSADVEQLTDAGQTVWGKYLMEDLFSYLDLQIEALNRCILEATSTDNMEKPAALLSETVQQLRLLRGAGSWDQICMRKNIDYGRLTFSKKCADDPLVEQIKAVRDACKKGMEKKLKSFSTESSRILADMRQSAAAVSGMVAMVREFGKVYNGLKRSRRILDFSDLEQKALDLFLGTRRERPTAAAVEVGAGFREIMVDEYQDSNEVQDAIISALTQQRQNCFMVGDVKQSIYQFRLADPTIFLEKYQSYTPAEQAQPGQGRKVLLSANFRSGGAVLAGVNDIFKACMSPAVGGLYYGEEEALREGVPHTPLGEPEVELIALPVQESTYDEEPALVAQRIAELLDGTHFIRDSESLRLIRPEDIAILLRSPGSVGACYIQALEQRGIRCVSGGGEDLLQTSEIAALRSLLQVICNPRQDIPLIAALASLVFGFSADDLAAFRGAHRWGSVFDALKKWENPKAEAFLSLLAHLRAVASMMTLTQLIEEIFVKTHIDSIYAAMPGGSVRRENLQIFFALAAEFETTNRRGLGQFLDFLESMEEKGLIRAGEPGAAGAVTLMSIHKSKGLEFPVVFVCGLSREFNRESVRAQVLCDKELGLGLTAVDEKNRVRYPTIAKRAIAVKTAADSLSEEMRVLYVALTRARDRLVMTYSSGNLETELQSMALRLNLGSRELLTRDVNCPGQWVLMAALGRTEAGELFAIGGKPEETRISQYPWQIRVREAPESAGAEVSSKKETFIPANVTQKLRRGLAFRYGHEAAVHTPSKQTATQRKGRDKDAEAAEKAGEPKPVFRNWRRPSFIESYADAAACGNATHACLQYIRYEACGNVEAVEREVKRLVEERFLTQEQADMVDCARIAHFFDTELGSRLCRSTNVLREFKFSVLDDGENYGSGLSGEKVLLQGVVDCALIDEDSITVIDFKTDQVSEQTISEKVSHYRHQVMAYATALERIYRKPVREAWLYFFDMERFTPVSISEA